MWREDTHNAPQYTFTIAYYAKWCEYRSYYTITPGETRTRHTTFVIILHPPPPPPLGARRKCKDANQKIIKSYLLYLHLMYTHTHSTRKMSANMLPSAHTTRQRACTDMRHWLWARVIIFRFVNSILDCVQFCHKCDGIKAHKNVRLRCLPPWNGVMCTHSAHARCSCR